MADILIITRDADATIEIAHLLGQAGEHEVAIATHGLQSPLTCFLFDLVIVDIRQNLQDGFDLPRSIRQHPARAALPILALVGELTVQDHAAIRAAGVDYVVATPCSPTVLHSALEQVFGPRERAGGAEPPLASPHAPARADIATMLARRPVLPFVRTPLSAVHWN